MAREYRRWPQPQCSQILAPRRKAVASATVPQNTGARKRRCPVGFSHRSWDQPDLAAENRPAVETAGDRISLAADTEERWLKPPPSVSCPGGFGRLGVIAGRRSRRCQFKHPLGVIPGWGFYPPGSRNPDLGGNALLAHPPLRPELLFRGGGFNPRGPGIQPFRVMPSEGVDADCVCIDPALTWDRDWLFPPNLDSGTPALKHLRPE